MLWASRFGRLRLPRVGLSAPSPSRLSSFHGVRFAHLWALSRFGGSATIPLANTHYYTLTNKKLYLMSLDILDYEAPKQKDGAYIFTYQNITKEELANRVDAFFIQQEGYRLEGGAKGSAIYGKGSTFWRILFGAFVKRYKFSIQVKALENGNVSLQLNKEMSGISGGVWGWSQMNKEHIRVAEALKKL
jgi:hypothetical protein